MCPELLMSQQKSPKMGVLWLVGMGQCRENIPAQGCQEQSPCPRSIPEHGALPAVPPKIPRQAWGTGTNPLQGLCQGQCHHPGPVGTGTVPRGWRHQSHARVMPESPFLGCGTSVTSPPSSAKGILSPLLRVILGQSRGKWICPLPPHQIPRFGPFYISPTPFLTARPHSTPNLWLESICHN